MWKIDRIAAKNICAFEEFEYRPARGQATLVFGDNRDSESQNSNGSGKSALIEAIAIGLTGEPLRKVNMDEIINDRFDEATVSLVLSNGELGCSMTVNRRLSRKNPQQIQVIRQTGPYDTDAEEISQPSVADYNRYVLDQIGLSKDDLLSNFILTARKYKSFLSAPDKEKKEIINRFSNGTIVDQSIEALQADIEPLEEDLAEAEKDVARISGAIAAISGEIENALNEAQSRKEAIQARIREWKQAIADQRVKIREAKEDLVSTGRKLDKLDELDVEMQKLEKSDVDTVAAYREVAKRFEMLKMSPIADYTAKIESEKNSLAQAESSLSGLVKTAEEAEKALLAARARKSETDRERGKATERLQLESKELEEAIQDLLNKAGALSQRIKDMESTRSIVSASIARLEKQLAGVIECPKCRHEFTLGGDVDIEESRQKHKECQAKLAQTEESIFQARADYETVRSEGKEKRERQWRISDERREWEKKTDKARSELSAVQDNVDRIERTMDAVKESVARIQERLSGLRRKMFDEVFDAIDAQVRQEEGWEKTHLQSISALEGSISTYERQVAMAEKNEEADLAANLRSSLEAHRKALGSAEEKRASIKEQVDSLKSQEARFAEFKTYLANTRISAISRMTNEFLSTIGSDIRVSLSGYTLLKSGKVRDKISVSVLRDGMDCGSYEKFSAGERVRLELASILAMRQLTNADAEEGKGLDLLICDEILDSSDETGLANIFKALNSTGVTSLVVSHGSIAENYPNRLVVHKQNGVSYIDDNSSKRPTQPGTSAGA